MRITVEIPDEFAAQVQAHGLVPKNYVEELIASQAAKFDAPAQEPGLNPELSMEEFNASLDALTRYSHKIPALPIDAFARESFYQDRD